ncbi:hypothetical protein BV22DRAFT_1127494 [Leucogyrophana mollusca]|uniref:Uncharacterized protein n=1 Tax=Leucogyrophana mollusca TaxID=85980 RepID=A0ACB8BP15_9AGAM|nr:hypothetical protein BV22DRAFT_1127494 [Leucogyrophana mollusca]
MEAEIINDVYILQVTRMSQLAAAVIIIYDHVQSIDKEVALIWRRPGSLVSILYFVNRYVGDAIIIISATLFLSTSFSANVIYYFNFKFGDHLRPSGLRKDDLTSELPLVFVSVAIMQLRIYAMYRKSKKVLFLTGICFAAEIAAIAVVLVMHFAQSLSYTNEPIPGFHMCGTSNIGKNFTAIYIPIFCFEFLLFTLALSVVFRNMARTRRIPGMWRLHATMEMIVKSSTIYFFVETSGCAIATGMYLGLPSIYIEIANAFLVATTVVLGSRLVINTRDFYSSSQVEEHESHDFRPLIHPSGGNVEMSVLREDDGEV